MGGESTQNLNMNQIGVFLAYMLYVNLTFQARGCEPCLVYFVSRIPGVSLCACHVL